MNPVYWILFEKEDCSPLKMHEYILDGNMFWDCLRREMGPWNWRVSIIEARVWRTPMLDNNEEVWCMSIILQELSMPFVMHWSIQKQILIYRPEWKSNKIFFYISYFLPIGLSDQFIAKVFSFIPIGVQYELWSTEIAEWSFRVLFLYNYWK